jgi:quercetin dioxygenase-like cupin family protein
MSHRVYPGRMDRRALLQSAAASAAVAGMFSAAESLVAEEPGKVSLRSFDQVEPQKFAWGWIRWLMNAEIDPQAEMTLGMVHIEPNQTNPRHVHPNSAEYLHVLSGSCEHLVGNRWVTLKAGDTLRVPKGVVHQARTKREPCRSMVLYDTGKRQMVPVDEKP